MLPWDLIHLPNILARIDILFIQEDPIIMKNVKKISIDQDIGHFYNEQGYVVLKDLIPREILERLGADLNQFFTKEAPPDNPCSSDSIDAIITKLDQMDSSKLHQIQVAASRLASFHLLASKIYECIPLITGQAEVVFLNAVGFLLGIPDNQRLSYDWHQDGTYHMDGKASVIHVWCPIFMPTNIENGAMSLLQKSHKEPLLKYEKIKISAGGYTSNKPSNIFEKKSQYTELCCSLDLGDCLFFGDNLIHKSNINKTDQCRIVAVLKFSQIPNYSNDQSSLVGV
jgi:ectoine hydroxylase-related dioxygenase (phytanoyl-CoA dioxygenase family)